MNIPEGAAAPPLNEPTYLRIKRALIDDLVSQAIKPGERLTIDMLTTRYRVSHMPIREALRQLEGEGVLQSLAHRGFRVEAITEESIRNLYDIRIAVESMLGRRAAERATDADIAELERLEAQYEELVLADLPRDAVKANVAFHNRLYATAGNREAELLLEGRTRVVRTVADGLDRYSPMDRRAIIPEHRSIIAAFRSRSPVECGQAVFEHVTNARDRLIERLRAADVAQ